MSAPSTTHSLLVEVDLSDAARARPLQRNVAKAADVLDHFVKSGAFCQEFYPSTHVASTFFWSFVVWRFRNSLKNSNVIPAKLAVALMVER